MPNLYQGPEQGGTYVPHAGSSSIGRNPPKQRSGSRPMGQTPPPSASSGGANWRTDPNSGHNVLISAAPHGVRRGAGALVGGSVWAANRVQGDNFYDSQGTNYQYHTLFALSVAFLIVFATQMYVKTGAGGTATEATGNNVRDSLNGASGAASLKAWALIAFVLFSMSSFKSTASLAAAFSWLILVSVVLMNGMSLMQMFGVKGSTPPGGRPPTNTQGK